MSLFTGRSHREISGNNFQWITFKRRFINDVTSLVCKTNISLLLRVLKELYNKRTVHVEREEENEKIKSCIIVLTQIISQGLLLSLKIRQEKIILLNKGGHYGKRACDRVFKTTCS